MSPKYNWKNRMRMFKEPNSSLEEFQDLFKNVNFGGIHFVGSTNSVDVNRSFCSCGWSDKEERTSCPRCGKTLAFVPRKYGYPTHEVTLFDVSENGTSKTLKRSHIVLNAPQGAVTFDVNIEVKDICSIDNVSGKVDFFPGYDRSFLDDGVNLTDDAQVQLEEIPILKKLFENRVIHRSALSTVNALTLFYWFPKLHEVSITRYKEFLSRVISNSQIFSRGIPEPPQELIDNGMAWEQNLMSDEDARSRFTIEDLAWLHNIPPEIGGFSRYISENYSYGYSFRENSYWPGKSTAQIQNDIKFREFFQSSLGQYLIHRFNSFGMSSSLLKEWGVGEYDMNYSELFEEFVIERADILNMEYKSMRNAFTSLTRNLESRGYVPTPETIRIRKSNSILNPGRYALSDYLDFEQELKHPTEMIIKMSKIIETEEE